MYHVVAGGGDRASIRRPIEGTYPGAMACIGEKVGCGRAMPEPHGGIVTARSDVRVGGRPGDGFYGSVVARQSAKSFRAEGVPEVKSCIMAC